MKALRPSTEHAAPGSSASSLSLRMRRRLGGRFLFLSSARAPASVAPWACRPDAERRRRPAGGRARGEAGARPAAAGEARDRRHLARHPHRPRDSAPADAGVPGRGAHRRADHRRLHDADRRSVGALGRAADPLRRGDRREREDLPRAGDGRPRPRPDRGALQRRVALEALLRRGRSARADDHGRAAPRARRLRQADGRRTSRSRSRSCSIR